MESLFDCASTTVLSHQDSLVDEFNSRLAFLAPQEKTRKRKVKLMIYPVIEQLATSPQQQRQPRSADGLNNDPLFIRTEVSDLEMKACWKFAWCRNNELRNGHDNSGDTDRDLSWRSESSETLEGISDTYRRYDNVTGQEILRAEADVVRVQKMLRLTMADLMWDYDELELA